MILPITGLGFLIYLGVYTPYFLSGHSLIEWFQAQKWILNFFLTSKLRSKPLMVLITLGTGLFKGWWGDDWQVVPEWTIAWPLSLVALLTPLKKTKGSDDQRDSWRCLTILLLGILGAYTVLPFWPRYLVLILPFLILYFVAFLVRQRPVIVVAVLLILGVQYFRYLVPSPTVVATEIESSWEVGMYKELYNYLSSADQERLSRDQFWREAAKIDRVFELNQKEVRIAVASSYPWARTVRASLTINYPTPVGELRHQVPLLLVKERNQWRLKWRWDYLLPAYSPGSRLEVQLDDLGLGVVQTSDGVTILRWGERPFISVIPDKIGDEEDLITKLSQLTKQSSAEIRVAIFVRFPGDWLVPVGFAAPGYNQDQLDLVKKDPAVKVGMRQTQIYHPELVKGGKLEALKRRLARNPEVNLTPGGRIRLDRGNGKTIILLKTEPKAGQEVVIDQTFGELL